MRKLLSSCDGASEGKASVLGLKETELDGSLLNSSLEGTIVGRVIGAAEGDVRKIGKVMSFGMQDR